MRAREAKTQLKQLASSTAGLRLKTEAYRSRFCGRSDILPVCPCRTGDLSAGSYDCPFFSVDEGGDCQCEFDWFIRCLEKTERKATAELERRFGDEKAEAGSDQDKAGE